MVEFDPIGNPPPSSSQSPQPEALPLKTLPYFKDSTPYTYALVGDQGALPQSGVALERVSGLPYDCIKSQTTGLANKCDTIFWMAPGRPQDTGAKFGQQTNPYETGVWKQQRIIGSNISAAASAPYTGIYTGLTGYIEQITNS